MSQTLRLGTRGSLLARTQSQLVADAIEKANPSVHVELVILKTTGDQVQDKPLAELGGKGLFTKELELALLNNEIDLAVHSYKDVPVTMPLVDQSGLVIACVPLREDARDVLACRAGAMGILDLPHGARVGTGSLRRRCQLLDLRPDLRIEPIRGNIDTRLRKMREGAYDAVVLAYAGLKRAGLFDSDVMSIVPTDQITPAPGQGALAIQTRRSDDTTRARLTGLNDESSARCVAIERKIVAILEGDCHSPIAAHARFREAKIELVCAVGATGGALPVKRSTAVFAPKFDEKSLFARLVEIAKSISHKDLAVDDPELC